MGLKEKLPHLVTGISLAGAVIVTFLLTPAVTWAPPLIKIGVVNWEQVILQYEDFQNKLNNLQSKRKRILRFIEKEYGEIKGESVKKGQKPASMDQELQKLYEDTLEQHKQRRKQTVEKYHRRIREAIREEAIEQGYSLILSENEVLYAAEGYTDLTNGVINRLNEDTNS